MAMANWLNLSGIVTIDFQEGLKSLDGFLAKVNDTVKKVEAHFDGINTSGFSSQLVDLGVNVGKMALAFDIAKNSMMTGFGELRKAGGDAFDYIGSKAQGLSKQAIDASSNLENLNRTLMVHIRDRQKADTIMSNLKKYDIETPFEISDLGRSARKFVARGVHDPAKVDQYVRLAGEMASVNDQDIGKAADALMKIKARSPEAYRSLKQNFTIGPDQLKAMGVTLDSGDRLRMRTGGDAQAVIDALQKYYQTNTKMEAAQQQSLTIMGKWSSLQSQIYMTMASYADIIAPKVKAAIDYFRGVAKALQDLSPATKNMIANFVLMAATAFTIVTALTPIALIISTLISGFVHLGIAAAASAVGIMAFRAIIVGANGWGNLATFLTGITSQLSSMPGVAGAAGLAFQSLGSSAASVGTKIAGPLGVLSNSMKSIGAWLGADIFGGPKNALGSVRNIGSTMGGFATNQFSNQATWLPAHLMPPKALQLPGGPTPGGYGSSTMVTAAPSMPSMATILGGAVGIAAIVATVIGVGGTLIANFWKKTAEDAGKKLVDESKSDVVKRQLKRLNVDAYIADKSTREKMGWGFGRTGGLSAEDQVKAKELLERDVTQTEALEGTPEKARRAEVERKRKIREGYSVVTGEKLSDEAAKAQFNKFTTGQYGAAPAYTEEQLKEPTGIEALQRTKEELNSPENVAKSRLDKFLARQARDGKQETPLEMSQKIELDRKRVERDTKLGYLSKDQQLDSALSLRKRVEKAGEGPDDIGRYDMYVHTAKMAKLNQDMYEKVDKMRQLDLAAERLSYDKKAMYLKQELSLLTKGTITREEVAKNKRQTNEALYLNNREIAAREKEIEIRKKGGSPLGSALALDNIQGLRKRSADLQSDDPTKGMRVLRDEDLKNIDDNKKNQMALDTEKHNHIMHLRAEDLKANGQHLNASLAQLQIHYHEQKIKLTANSAELLALTKNYYQEQAALRIQDFLDWKKMETDKQQFLRDRAMHKTSKELEQADFDESVGKFDYGKRVKIRAKQKKQTLDNIEKATQDELDSINTQLGGRVNKDGTVTTGDEFDGDVATQVDRNPKGGIKGLDLKKRQQLRNRKKELEKILEEGKADTEQSSRNTSRQESDKEKKRNYDNAYNSKKTDAESLELRERALGKRLGGAKTSEDAEKIGKQQEQNLKAQYDAQLELLNLKNETAKLHTQEGSPERANADKQYALDKKKLQMEFLEKMKETTAEMEKQMKLLKDQQGGSGFTMGGVYNSYDEIVKHDSQTADKFKSRYESGSNTDDMQRAQAALKLGVPYMSPSDITDGLKVPGGEKGNVKRDAWGNVIRPMLRGSVADFERREGPHIQDQKPIINEITVNIDGKFAGKQTQTLNGSQIANGNGMNYKHPREGLG